MTPSGQPGAPALRHALLAVALAAAAVAWVVLPAGVAIESPSFGKPEILTPGAEFPLVARAGLPWAAPVESAALVSVAARIPLTPLGPAGRGMRRASRFRIPADCPPGNYDLVALAGGRESRARRAVSVLAAIPERFTVAQITDLHFGYTPDGDASVERIVDEVNRVKPDLVVVTGDIAHNGRWDQYDRAQRVLERLTMPFVCIPGNHDRRGWGAYLTRFGVPSLPVAFGRWTILGLDCGQGRDEFTESQLLFIRHAMDTVEPGRVIVLAHIPLAGKRSVRVHAGEVMELFERKHVPLVLSGHWHYGADYSPEGPAAAKRGTQFVVTVTAGGWLVTGPSGRTDQRGFTLVTVADGRITSVQPRTVAGATAPAPSDEGNGP
jgi:Icc protein